MSDFNISSISNVDLTSECKILGVPAKIAQSGDDTEIGNYLANNGLLSKFESDLGIGQTQASGNKTQPVTTDQQGQELDKMA